MEAEEVNEERKYIIRRFGMSPGELKTFDWLLHYGKKMAEQGKNSMLNLKPEHWNEDLEGACDKVLRGLNGE